MRGIFDGRYAAQLDEPIVLFLIGMRINRLHAVHKWLPVARAMPRMLRELAKRPEAGMLWYRGYQSGRVALVQQYWRSFEHLIAYAHDREGAHFPAWGAFNRAVGNDGTVGIWHETYLIEAGKFESIYGNMPRFGLAAAGRHVKAEGRLASAKTRFAA